SKLLDDRPDDGPLVVHGDHRPGSAHAPKSHITAHADSRQHLLGLTAQPPRTGDDVTAEYNAGSSGRPLVHVMSHIERDPRDRRKVKWMTTAGWTVETVGPSEVRLPGVRDRYTVTQPATPRFGRPETLAFWTTLPHRAKF